MFGIVLNTPLSYFDSISYFNTDDNTAFPSSETQGEHKWVIGEHKWVIDLIFPLVQDQTLIVLNSLFTIISYYVGQTPAET